MASYTGKFEIYVNGRIQAECTKIDYTVKSNDTKVATLQKGNCGHADGAAECTITLDSLVPQAGKETNFAKLVASKASVELVIKENKADKIRARGRFTDATGSSAVNSPTTTSATFDGYAPTFG